MIFLRPGALVVEIVGQVCCAFIYPFRQFIDIDFMYDSSMVG